MSKRCNDKHYLRLTIEYCMVKLDTTHFQYKFVLAILFCFGLYLVYCYCKTVKFD